MLQRLNQVTNQAQQARVELIARTQERDRLQGELRQAQASAAQAMDAQTRENFEAEIASLTQQQQVLQNEIAELERRTGASSSAGSSTNASADFGANLSSAHVQGKTPSAAGAGTSAGGWFDSWFKSDDKESTGEESTVEEFERRIAALKTNLESLKKRFEAVKTAIETAIEKAKLNRKQSKTVRKDADNDDYEPEMDDTPLYASLNQSSRRASVDNDDAINQSMTGPELMQWQENQQPEQGWLVEPKALWTIN